MANYHGLIWLWEKPYVFVHKCDLVHFLLRQRGSSFAASREFCGDLTACLFLVVFWLAVKIFGSFTATFAEIRLGGYRLWLGVCEKWYDCCRCGRLEHDEHTLYSWHCLGQTLYSEDMVRLLGALFSFIWQPFWRSLSPDITAVILPTQ